MKKTSNTKELLDFYRKSAPAAGAALLYELTVYTGDISTNRVFTTVDAAMAAWHQVETGDEPYTDAALCELILDTEANEFINNSYSLI